MTNLFNPGYLGIAVIPGALLLLLALCSMAFKIDKPTATLADLKWLTGTWKDNKEKNLYTTWEYSDDAITGKTYNLKKEKEEVTQHMTIKAVDGTLFYTEQATDKKNNEPVTYGLILAKDGGFVFAYYQSNTPTGVVLKQVDNKSYQYKGMMSFGGSDNWQVVSQNSLSRTSK